MPRRGARYCCAIALLLVWCWRDATWWRMHCEGGGVMKVLVGVMGWRRVGDDRDGVNFCGFCGGTAFVFAGKTAGGGCGRWLRCGSIVGEGVLVGEEWFRRVMVREQVGRWHGDLGSSNSINGTFSGRRENVRRRI
ncbi:hypothetical protein Tco_0179861 [Tanacetum coccineum]